MAYKLLRKTLFSWGKVFGDFFSVDFASNATVEEQKTSAADFRVQRGVGWENLPKRHIKWRMMMTINLEHGPGRYGVQEDRQSLEKWFLSSSLEVAHYLSKNVLLCFITSCNTDLCFNTSKNLLLWFVIKGQKPISVEQKCARRNSVVESLYNEVVQICLFGFYSRNEFYWFTEPKAQIWAQLDEYSSKNQITLFALQHYLVVYCEIPTRN